MKPKPFEIIVEFTPQSTKTGITYETYQKGLLIRCKDCKYYTGKWCTKYSTKQIDINDICKADDDFCSMAEMKE